jgi:hypothetical protein
MATALREKTMTSVGRSADAAFTSAPTPANSKADASTSSPPATGRLRRPSGNVNGSTDGDLIFLWEAFSLDSAVAAKAALAKSAHRGWKAAPTHL